MELVLALGISATGCSDAAQPAGEAPPASVDGSVNGDRADSGGPGSPKDPAPGPDGGTGPCALPDYPNAGCTGVPAGTALTVINEDMTVREPNTVIDGKEIHGCLRIQAPGVVIRRSKISCSSSIVVGSYKGEYSGTGLLIEDSEIHCNGTQGTAVGDTNLTARRVNVHGCENGFDVDGKLIVEDSYIHDMIPYDKEKDPHDGLQITDIGHDVVIRHNTIYVPDATSAIISAARGDVLAPRHDPRRHGAAAAIGVPHQRAFGCLSRDRAHVRDRAR